MVEVLKITGLTAGYGLLRVLHEIDFRVTEGERVGLVGLNGHGKTTLFRAIPSLVGWQSGSILLNGVEVGGSRSTGPGRKTAAIVRAGLAMTPQGDAIFPGLTEAQHLDCGAYTVKAWKDRKARRDMVFDIFPPLRKLEHALVGRLSGGERRMVSVGRALMVEASLYLIDEPSLGLAPKISASVIEALFALPKDGRAMVIAEQNVALLSGRVDRMVGMHAGRIRGDVGHVSLHCKWRSRLNPKTLEQERFLADKRPIWWALGLGALALSTPFLSNAALNIAAIFCIFSAINVLWTLVIGTAGIFSLATLAIVGIGAYVSAALNVYLGLPWPLMFVAGGLAGLVVGGFLALPSTRLDGLYDALLTMGFAEICRVFVQQLKALGPKNGSINNVDSFIPAEWQFQRPRLLLGFAGAFVLLLLALLLFRVVNSERLGMLLQTAREDEAFAEATGIDSRRARLHVFLISSAGLQGNRVWHFT